MPNEGPASKWANFWASPAGGLAAAVLLKPTGCSRVLDTFETCPPGQKTNVLNLNMGGMVGVFDDATIALIAFVVAGLIGFFIYAIHGS